MSAAFALAMPRAQRRLSLANPPVAPAERHRPKSLGEIVGQGAIVWRLQEFLEAPYSCAMLFEGPTGVGKTTAALCLAAELGAVEYGGLEQIKSGMQDADAVGGVLDSLRFTPMMGSGWKVVIVDEADWMSPKAAQIWLSALEDLPPKSVVVFTTNHAEKFPQRFLDRCERFRFASDPSLVAQDAQALADRIWESEGATGAAPRVAGLPNVVDSEGAISFRRVVQAVALRATSGRPKPSRVAATPKPAVAVATAPDPKPDPEPLPPAKPKPERKPRPELEPKLSKPKPIKHVRQVNDYDGGLAVAAMVARRKYAEAQALDPDPNATEELSPAQLAGVLETLSGHAWQIKAGSGAPIRGGLPGAPIAQLENPNGKGTRWIAAGECILDPSLDGPRELKRYGRRGWIVRRVLMPV